MNPAPPPQNLIAVLIFHEPTFSLADLNFPKPFLFYAFRNRLNNFLDNDDQQTKVIAQLRTTVPGLKKYTNYSITVLSYTTLGDGVRSEPVYCHTDEDGAFYFLNKQILFIKVILFQFLRPRRK